MALLTSWFIIDCAKRGVCIKIVTCNYSPSRAVGLLLVVDAPYCFYLHTNIGMMLTILLFRVVMNWK